MTWRNRMPFHCGNQNSYSSRQAGWSVAMWKRPGFSWAPHRQLSQRQHLAWYCSAAPQTGAWTGWPEVVASVASHWTSGVRKQDGAFETYSYICLSIWVCEHVSEEDFIHYTSTAEQRSLCFTAWGLSVSIISYNSATLLLVISLISDFVCATPHHYSELFRLSQVIIFILHLSQDSQLLWCWKLFDKVLRRNKWENIRDLHLCLCHKLLLVQEMGHHRLQRQNDSPSIFCFWLMDNKHEIDRDSSCWRI